MLNMRAVFISDQTDVYANWLEINFLQIHSERVSVQEVYRYYEKKENRDCTWGEWDLLKHHLVFRLDLK